jgi:hypothetical protein
MFRRLFGGSLRALALLLTIGAATAPAAFAQATSTLSGQVTAGNHPVAGAAVTASGSNLTLHAKTDARGVFTMSVPIGTYDVGVTAPEGSAALRVDVPAAGANVTLSLTQLKEIGHTSVTARPPVRGSGTDLNLNSEALTRAAQTASCTSTAITATSTTSSTVSRSRKSSTAWSAASSTPTTLRLSKRCKARTPRSTASASRR